MTLTPEIMTRVTGFFVELDKRIKARAAAEAKAKAASNKANGTTAAAPKATPKPAAADANPLGSMDDLYVKYDRSTYTASEATQEVGSVLFTGNVHLIFDMADLHADKMEVASGYDAPLTLFVWGPQRVLPVQLTSMTVTETIFDAQLNPIQATVKLEMRALTYSDLDPNHKGYSLFLAYQKSKEGQARRGATGGNTRELLGVDVRA